MGATVQNLWTLDDSSFFVKKECWAIVLSVCLLPMALKKELAELKVVSIALFCAALLFVAFNIVQSLARGNSLTNPDTEYSKYFKPNQPIVKDDLINSLATIFTACNFQVNLFPIHSN